MKENLLRKSLFAFAACALAAGTVACDDGGNESRPDDPAGQSESERLLSAGVTAFVDRTVIPTYKSLADASIELLATCETMLDRFNAGQLTTADVEAADEAWIEARLYWELSEAFLYGAAGDYNIDPHIDSWPLDRTALQGILDNENMMAAIEADPDYAGANFGYGLLGFHALEYMIFEEGGPRALDKYTHAQLVFLVSVATDLRDQCIRLEAAWAGMENVTDEKQQILTDAELEPSFDYGESMRQAGTGGSLYVSYAAAAEEIIQGCIDIATEVGGQKIGRPAKEGEESYVESPYSRNSQTDFADNIRSIRNAYQGQDGIASISDYVKSVDAGLDTEVRATIEEAIRLIEAAPGPFVLRYEDAAWDEAADYCNDVLVTTLERVQETL